MFLCCALCAMCEVFFVFVLCFVFGMLLTPPDIISQTLLAIPMWMLFEIGIMFGRMVAPKTDPDAPLTD